MILNAIESGMEAPVALLHGLFGAAANFGTVQRRLARSFRVIALDLRNHGTSPHGAVTGYADLAADVLETLAARDALPAAIVGHSMGGKAAMAAALARPGLVSRLVVSDIAPVRYEPAYRAFAEAMRAIPLTPGLTRAAADAALAGAVPDSGIRAFLLQNLRFGAAPAWRIGLDEIAAALPVIEGWEDPSAGTRYEGPALFVAGERSDYVRPEYRAPIRALFPAARFLTLKGAGHWVHADNPEGFASVLESFLG